MQKSLSVVACLFSLSLGTAAQAEDGQQEIRLTRKMQPQILAMAEMQPIQQISDAAFDQRANQRMKNYAPFIRGLVQASAMMNPVQKSMKAARVMRGNKQVIVLGGP